VSNSTVARRLRFCFFCSFFSSQKSVSLVSLSVGMFCSSEFFASVFFEISFSFVGTRYSPTRVNNHSLVSAGLLFLLVFLICLYPLFFPRFSPLLFFCLKDQSSLYRRGGIPRPIQYLDQFHTFSCVRIAASSSSSPYPSTLLSCGRSFKHFSQKPLFWRQVRVSTPFFP